MGRHSRSTWAGANVFPPVLHTNHRMLRCWNEFWEARAVWEKRGNEWVGVQAAPIIEWMRGKVAAEAKLELARLGCNWEWEAFQPPT